MIAAPARGTLTAAMLFTWLRRRRRRKLLAEPVPASWRGHLDRNFEHWKLLTPDEQARLLAITRVLVAEKNWEGAGGLALTEEMVVTIAAQAALLLLGLDHDYYRRVQSVVVYPSGYLLPDRAPDRAGVVSETPTPVHGTAHALGAVVLSWRDAREGGRHAADGFNLVFHEFAHQLDLMDGVMDGTPPLRGRDRYREWFRVMTAHFEDLRRAEEEGRPTLLDPYGATNVAEFFSVVTEAFFEQPLEMQAHHPELYAVLRDFYGQDPAERMRRHRREGGGEGPGG